MFCETTSRKPFCTLTALLFAISGVSSLFADEPAVVLIIRSGALHPAELSPEENVTPNLRSLVRSGGSVASSRDDENSDGGDLGRSILNRVMPLKTIKELRNENISTVIIDPDGKAKRDDEKMTSKARNRTLSAEQAQALAGLARHVGKPKPASPEEATVVTSLRKILGLRGAAASRGDSASSGATKDGDRDGASRADLVATRVRSSLKKGARLVVVLDRVRSKTAKAASRRDTLLDTHRRAITTREGATLAVLSFSSDAPTSGLLILWGPKIRSGWVVPRSVAVDELGPTLLWLVGKSLKSERELIDDLLLD